MQHMYPAPTASQPLVLPMSAIALFRRCRKAYEFSYELDIAGTSSEAANLGTAFHEMAAAHYSGEGAYDVVDTEAHYNMLPVWEAYRKSGRLPDAADVLSVEQPIYAPIARNTRARATFDLVYRGDGGWIVARDYKTFEKAPTYDVDLDFQGRFYIAMLMRHYKTDKVLFEYEYVRRVPPGTPNSKGAWREDECYIRHEVVISQREVQLVWDEAVDTVRDLLRARREGRFYRSGTRREFGSPCFGCFHADVCKAEMQFGKLDAEDIALLAPQPV